MDASQDSCKLLVRMWTFSEEEKNDVRNFSS